MHGHVCIQTFTVVYIYICLHVGMHAAASWPDMHNAETGPQAHSVATQYHQAGMCAVPGARVRSRDLGNAWSHVGFPLIPSQHVHSFRTCGPGGGKAGKRSS